MSRRLPRLVPWLEAGVLPGELRRKIRSRESEENQRTAESLPEGQFGPTDKSVGQSSPYVPRNGTVRGVSLVADDLLASLDAIRRAKDKRKNSEKIEGQKAISWMTHGLLLWCHHENQGPPDQLIRLAFELLCLTEDEPPRGIGKFMPNWPRYRNRYAQYFAALEHDARHLREHGFEMDASALARCAKVDRKTIAEWRTGRSEESQLEREAQSEEYERNRRHSMDRLFGQKAPSRN